MTSSISNYAAEGHSCFAYVNSCGAKRFEAEAHEVTLLAIRSKLEEPVGEKRSDRSELNGNDYKVGLQLLPSISISKPPLLGVPDFKKLKHAMSKC